MCPGMNRECLFSAALRIWWPQHKFIATGAADDAQFSICCMYIKYALSVDMLNRRMQPALPTGLPQ
jgi:hypothetical protein